MGQNQLWQKVLDEKGNPVLGKDGDFVMELIEKSEVPDPVIEPTLEEKILALKQELEEKHAELDTRLKEVEGKVDSVPVKP